MKEKKIQYLQYYETIPIIICTLFLFVLTLWNVYGVFLEQPLCLHGSQDMCTRYAT